jgi:hypothetical protein
LQCANSTKELKINKNFRTERKYDMKYFLTIEKENKDGGKEIKIKSVNALSVKNALKKVGIVMREDWVSKTSFWGYYCIDSKCVVGISELSAAEASHQLILAKTNNNGENVGGTISPPK